MDTICEYSEQNTAEDSWMKKNAKLEIGADLVFKYAIFYWDQRCHKINIKTKGFQVSKYQLKPVWKALIGKYDLMFHNFKKNQISMIMYNISSAPVTLAYKDLTILTQQKQYIRRYYSNTDNGYGSQISLKMKLITNSYGKIKQKKLTYQYPTAFITDTAKIFANRIRCINKNKAIDLSSEISPKKLKNKYMITESYQSKNVLVLSLNTSFISHSDSLFREFMKNIDHDISYDSQSFDVYCPPPSLNASEDIDDEQEEICIDLRPKNLEKNLEGMIFDFGLLNNDKDREFNRLIQSEGDQFMRNLAANMGLNAEKFQKLKEKIMKEFEKKQKNLNQDKMIMKNKARMDQLKQRMRGKKIKEQSSPASSDAVSSRKGSAKRKAEQLMKKIEKRVQVKQQYEFDQKI